MWQENSKLECQVIKNLAKVPVWFWLILGCVIVVALSYFRAASWDIAD